MTSTMMERCSGGLGANGRQIEQTEVMKAIGKNVVSTDSTRTNALNFD